MRLGSIGSPSPGCAAPRGPTRLRMRGSTLGAPCGKCTTTNTDARRLGGRSLTTRVSASTPPEEAPMTTMSCPANVPLSCSSRLPSAIRKPSRYNVTGIPGGLDVGPRSEVSYNCTRMCSACRVHLGLGPRLFFSRPDPGECRKGCRVWRRTEDFLTSWWSGPPPAASRRSLSWSPRCRRTSPLRSSSPSTSTPSGPATWSRSSRAGARSRSAPSPTARRWRRAWSSWCPPAAT